MKLKKIVIILIIIIILVLTYSYYNIIEQFENAKKTVVALCCNESYYEKALQTIKELRTTGQYNGDIVFFYDSDFTNSELLDTLKNSYNVLLKQFPKLDTSKVVEFLNNNSNSEFERLRNKMFQYHKFYIFDLYFKNWDSVLYIDCGMHIYNPIHRILDINVDKLFYAHSDSYPAYIRKLDSQFINSNSIYDNLKNDYDLTTKDYFQSGVVYFDTHIIKENIVRDLMELVNKYPIGNGDQAFMNLYFIDKWKPLPVKDNSGFLYDYWERDNNKSSDYVMLKYPKT